MSDKNNSLIYWILTFIVGVLIALVSNYLITGRLVHPESNPLKSEAMPSGAQLEQPMPVENEKNIDTPNIRDEIYDGTVGKWIAQFSLKFDYSEKSISGTYFYPNRPNVVYTLSGRIIGNRIELTEYTDNKITAKCTLTSVDKSCYSGVMNNLDGRSLSMKFCKK